MGPCLATKNKVPTEVYREDKKIYFLSCHFNPH